MKICIIFIALFCLSLFSEAQINRTTINLNGTWQFDQTMDAFPPKKFTRTIPVPGLIHLATPRIEDYDKFFQHPEKSELKTTHSLYDIDYTPRYSWYKKVITIPESLEGQEAVLSVLKSQYVTQLVINGHDFGTFMECYTPVEANVTRALKYGEENEILIRVGDRTWLPSEAAGSTDKEKEHYLPGIWDDVTLSFTGKIRINRLLLLPSLKEKQLTVKVQLRNYFPAQLGYGDPMIDTVSLKISIYEKKSGVLVASRRIVGDSKRDNLSQLETQIAIPDAKAWSPEDPFLYEAKAEVVDGKTVSDVYTDHFGMRDFTRNGKYFYLNGNKTFLRGTNVTLQRFFEDPDCSNLVWDKDWVKEFLITIPKGLDWNAMRICVGIVPDFWYDLADEYGLMFQNEWNYWQNHGWDEQIRKEYTDWVWSDGNHPSVVIWDAINENWDSYIGNELIPELMELDPTRIWDAGYMTAEQLGKGLDEMDEPHPYEGPRPWIDASTYSDSPYLLGDLDYRNRVTMNSIESNVAQLVNEYGWIWLWRNGEPSKLTVDVFKYFLGENSTAAERWNLQAYWLQLETEWLRSIRQHAGVLAFCYLTNNYGYTGDWFLNNIKDLEPSLTLYWLKHAFAPQSVFINLPDGRYVKQQKAYKAGDILPFKLFAINDKNEEVKGNVKLILYDEKGVSQLLDERSIHIPATGEKSIAVSINLPTQAGGYLMVAEFTPENGAKVISRRYIKVGELAKYNFFDISNGKT